MKAECSTIVAGIFCVILLSHQARSQTKFSLTEEKGGGKQEGKKQIPTFIGSDGVVRKVTPGAILDEMKRCIPPGLPIPISTAWPELPPHLEELQEEKDPKNEPRETLDEGFRNLKDPEGTRKISQEKRRVSRSNDKNIGEMGVDVTNDQSMNVKLEGPTKDVGIFPPKDLDQNKMAEVLKAMLSRQMRRQNLTAEYVDDFSVRPRLRKRKQGDDYEDYDYMDPDVPKMSNIRLKTNQGKKHNKNSFQTQIKRQRTPKMGNRWRHNQRKLTRKQQRHKNKPDYDYGYEESTEDIENLQNNKQKCLQAENTDADDNIPYSDELEKQIELNDFLEKYFHDGIPERMENIDKFIKRSGHFKTKSGENMDVLEGYQKMLVVIMKLNTTLIRLLDKFSTLFQKGLPRNHPDSTGRNQNEDEGKSSVIWDFMDLLMQQRRRGTRYKRENGPCLPRNSIYRADESEDTVASPDGTQTITFNPSAGRTNLDLLQWLLKWYLSATSK